MFNNPNFSNPYAQIPIPQTPMLPQQQVIQVNGKASVDTIRLAPNSSVLVLDTSAPLVWLCVSDGVGRVSSVPYTISEYKAETPENALQSVAERFTAIEERITAMEAKLNNEPDVNLAKSK